MSNGIRSARVFLCFVSLVTLTSPLNPSGSAKPPQDRTTLTFADRVTYQYAIENVYWRHRIWPKENPGAKPGLDAVMSRAQIERKVEDYLRDSQLLEDRWQRPVTPEQLQTEMERVAQDTKRPDVLREVFAALGNDPFVIAECLARPILAERFATNRAVAAGVPPASNFFAAGTAASTEKTSAAYRLPAIINTPDTCFDNWVPTGIPDEVPARYLQKAVWTGSEMIVWGGNAGSSYTGGGRYSPTTDSWSAVSTINEPPYRDYHTAVWTGSEMIIWGGLLDPAVGGGATNSGGRYNPASDSWIATNTKDAPLPRAWHTAVWTGSEMIVWGGHIDIGDASDGSRYNPSTDSWTSTSPPPVEVAGRSYHTAVWTGTEMIVWGGLGQSSFLNSGGRYNPNMDSWTDTGAATAPDARWFHTTVWTGSEMVVWGGNNDGGDLNTGGRYNPVTNSWTDTTTTNAPDARSYHTAVWTGTEMIIWGGTQSPTNSGGRYNPSNDSWTATTTNNAPEPRFLHTAVWTGTEMIVWGGADVGGRALGTGGRYCGQPSSPTLQSAVSRKTHGGAGTFDVTLPLTGTPGIECRSSGATHDYTMVVTFSGNVTVTGNPQAQITLGTGCVGSSGTCTGNVTVSGNTVTVPLTNIANAQRIQVRINGVNSAADAPMTDFTIPMSILIGDTNANGTVNAGDVAQTKGRLGQTVDATNFRSDVNANGSINAGDGAIVKQNSGTSLPP